MTSAAHVKKARQLGTTLMEVAVFTIVVVPLMVALASTVSVFSKASTTSHHRTTASAQNHRILQSIVAELMQSSTRRDHVSLGNALTPQPENVPPSTTNSAYYYVAGEPVPPISQLHATLSRDGWEYWTQVQSVRRFYIYATYQPFDTIEFQKVHTPLDNMSHVSAQSGTVTQPWSARRKIFLENHSVLLRVEIPGEDPRTVVLGTHVDSLKFHLNADGHIIVRLTTRSGEVDPTAAAQGASAGVTGSQLTTQVTVAPRNELF